MKYKIGQYFPGYGEITNLCVETNQYDFGGQYIHERVLDDYSKELEEENQ